MVSYKSNVYCLVSVDGSRDTLRPFGCTIGVLDQPQATYLGQVADEPCHMPLLGSQPYVMLTDSYRAIVTQRQPGHTCWYHYMTAKDLQLPRQLDEDKSTEDTLGRLGAYLDI